MGKDLCRRNYKAREDMLAPRGRHSALPASHTGNPWCFRSTHNCGITTILPKSNREALFSLLSPACFIIFLPIPATQSHCSATSLICKGTPRPYSQQNVCVSVLVPRFLLPARLQKVSLRSSVEGIVSCFFSNGNS